LSAALGWQVAGNMRSDLAIDALEMAIWARRHDDLDGLVHHSDRGVQDGFKGSSQQCR
jgi:putative transposase